MEKTFTKNGQTQTTSSAERAVRLRFEGWREIDVDEQPDATLEGSSPDPLTQGGLAGALHEQISEALAGDSSPEPTAPPKGGAGSGVAAWLEYADQFPNVDVPADPTREQVIEALDAAGIPTE